MDEYIDYKRIYHAYGELDFPLPERVYFDHLSHEFSYNSKHLKLLDIGYQPNKMFKSLLSSQNYTKQLIEYILKNNKDTVFIVARSVKEWKEFLGNLWKEDRFIVSNAYLGQHYIKKSLEEGCYDKIIKAFKS